MDDSAQVQAAALLGCRRNATAPEVRSAYRRAVRTARPDLGEADGAWLVRVQAARDLLLARAAPDRRRRPRTATAVPAGYVALRRDTWRVAPRGDPEVDLRL